MDKELAVVLGMTLSYVASLAGMFIGMWAYRKRRHPSRGGTERSEADVRSR
jgi:hypothetical protein